MDTYGKVVEVILVPGTDENGYFDYFVNATRKLLPSWGYDAIPQNHKQKSVVFNNNNEVWVCQFLYFPSVGKEYEIVVHVNARGEMRCVDVTVPDTDEYRCGTSDLWAALGEFLCISMNATQVKHLEQAVSRNSNGVFTYQHSYYDIRSYHLGRSATMQEVATMLSTKIER